MRGSLLRTEVYAEDGTDKADKPYTVTEQSFIVRMEQPQGKTVMQCSLLTLINFDTYLRT
jgi:hypothetical protein